MIKSSLVYLLVGAFLGAFLLMNKAIPIDPGIWAWLPVHIELMIFGWIIQFTLGVAYWILPRFLDGEARGNSITAYAMVLSINLGIWLKIVAELPQIKDSLRLVALCFELLAVLLFISLHWQRIITYNK